MSSASGLVMVQRGPRTRCTFPDLAPCSAIEDTGGAAVGDYDRDGAPDVFLTRIDGPSRLFRNRGDGRFEDATDASGIIAPPGANTAAWGDLDGDGDLDLIVDTLGQTRMSLFVSAGDGTFTEQATERGLALGGDGLTHVLFGLAIGDYDADGWLDVHVSEWLTAGRPNPTHTRLFRNRGDAAPGHFEDVTVAAGVALDNMSGPRAYALGSTFSDLDDDGVTDLAVIGDYGTSRLFWGAGDGTFVDGTIAARIGTEDNGMGSVIADLDGDGALDWFITSIYEPDVTFHTGNRLFRNLGGRTFEDATDRAGVREGGWGWGAVAIDYDADGALDLAMTNGYPGEAFELDPMRLWHNDGHAVFEEVSASAGLVDREQGRALVTLDYDRDGDEDLLVVRASSSPLLYRDDGDPTRTWLRVRPLARHGGLPAPGARVIVLVDPSSTPLVREISAGGSYLGQSEPFAQFALPRGATSVAEVRITWPSRATAVLRDVPADQTVDVPEPD